MNLFSKCICPSLPRLFAAVCCIGFLFAQVARAQTPSIQVMFNTKGISSLSYQGNQLLSNGAPKVKRVDLSNYESVMTPGSTMPSSTLVNSKLGQVTNKYTWGTVTSVYKTSGARLQMTVTITNTSSRVISGLLLQLLELKLPGGSKGFDLGFRRAHNVEEPSVVSVSYPKGIISLVNEQMARPLYIGFPASIDEKNITAVYPVLVANTADPVFPRKSPQFTNMWLDFPNIERPIYPGASDTYNLSLRFGSQNATVAQVAGDALNRFAAAYPRTLKWADRRPIGMLFMGGVERVSATDPHGYYIQTTADIKTPEGIAEFKQRMMALATSTISNLKAMNCQGVVFWDLEGYMFPAVYIGDPRNLPPEMAASIDDFMKAFRDAGFRVGLTLRPQYPNRMLYSDVVSQTQVLNPTFLLEEKVKYAKEHWQCSLFYVDSDCNFDEYGKYNDEAAYRVLPATVFEKVAKDNPDVLIMPEHENTRYYAYTAPYNELRQGYTGTPPMVSRVYPMPSASFASRTARLKSVGTTWWPG